MIFDNGAIKVQHTWVIMIFTAYWIHAGFCAKSKSRVITRSDLYFVPEGAQSAWTLQETHRNLTNYARDEAQTSERPLD